MKYSSLPQTEVRWAQKFFSTLLVGLLVLGSAQAAQEGTQGQQEGEQQAQPQEQQDQGNTAQSSMVMQFQDTEAEFRILPVIDTLVANDESETTLVALLSTVDGSPIEGQRVRFVVDEGNAFLGEADGNNVAADAEEVGNGVYTARLRAGTVEGQAQVSAVWVSSPDASLPEVTTSVSLVTADQLMVEVDDKVLLADGSDEATIIAYLKDGLNRPVNNANVTFRLLSGSGTLRPAAAEGVNGRYAAVYRAGTTPGQAEVEVALPTNTQMLRNTVSFEIVKATELSAEAFPTRVARRTGAATQLAHTSTILVPVRDGDGDLVRGLTSTELVAQVISGPGEVTGPEEVILASGDRSGIYKFTFVAGETTSESTVMITNLSSPTLASTEVTVETVTQVNPSRLDEVRVLSFADEPFYADGASQTALLLFAADRNGNAVSGLGQNLDVSVVNGQGQVEGVGTELGNLTQASGTGVYLTTFTAGKGSSGMTSNLRTTFTNDDGTIETQEVGVQAAPLESPRIVIFPSRVPSGQDSVASIDIFDFDSRSIDQLSMAGLMAVDSNVRYRANVINGPGRIDEQVTNSGSGLDLVADDNVSTATFDFGQQASGAAQDSTLRVIDLAASGFPATDAPLEIGQETEITAVTSPTILDQGDTIQVIAFARDEFGLPAVGHELAVTVTSGSAEALNGGRLLDNGSAVGGFLDPYGEDGMYVGAIRATGTTGGTVDVTVTDLTSPNQPEATLQIEVGK